MKNQRFKVLALSALLSSGTFVGASYAADVGDVMDAGADKVSAAKSAQAKVDKISDQTYSLLQDFKGVNKQIEGLRVYNAQLEAQLANQKQTMVDLQESIENATVMERQITPLTLKMIDSLEQFIALDVPFLQQEREERIASIRENMERDDLSTAEKFRQVLEAYKIETEYGQKIDTYKEVIDTGAGDREVNILRVGRIALLYQTTDQSETGAWDNQSRSWVELDSSYRSPVSAGIRIAKKQASIDIMKLPIPAPEAR
ncbi:MAG: DUF3450 domain-containing protein [bacterium]